MSDRVKNFQGLRGTSVRRLLTAGLVAAGLLFGVVEHAGAQNFPNRPLRLIVPFAAGGPTDIVGRVVADNLAKRIGQPVVVDNRAGAGSTIGTDAAAKAAPDGYTIFLGSSSLTINPLIYPKLPYDALRDFAAIQLVARIPNVLAVHPSVPAKTLAEFLALARANPGKVTYGNSGRGTADHLIGVMFASLAKVELLDVPYKSSPPMLADLMGGQINATFNSLASTIPHIRSGKLRAIGVTTAKRSTGAPDIPSLAEAGLPGFDVFAWFGIFAPAQVNADILNKLASDVTAAIGTPEARERIGGVGGELEPMSREAFGTLVRDETVRWARLVKEANLKFD